MSRWFGVDLDGTLAKYDRWVSYDHIGEPVPAMLERVKRWIAGGRTVKIVTARVSVQKGREDMVKIIQDWCEAHGLPRLEVTCCKDYAMIELWDDRAVQVQMNTGKVLGEKGWV